MKLRTKMNFLVQGFQKLQHYRQTDVTNNMTTPHGRVVEIKTGDLLIIIVTEDKDNCCSPENIINDSLHGGSMSL